MGLEPVPWNWSKLWRGSKYSPEGAVVIGVFSIIVALSLIVATLLFGYGIRGSGLDPRLTSYVVGSGFVLMGVLGIALGIRHHRSRVETWDRRGIPRPNVPRPNSRAPVSFAKPGFVTS